MFEEKSLTVTGKKAEVQNNTDMQCRSGKISHTFQNAGQFFKLPSPNHEGSITTVNIVRMLDFQFQLSFILQSINLSKNKPKKRSFNVQELRNFLVNSVKFFSNAQFLNVFTFAIPKKKLIDKQYAFFGFSIFSN